MDIHMSLNNEDMSGTYKNLPQRTQQGENPEFRKKKSDIG